MSVVLFLCLILLKFSSRKALIALSERKVKYFLCPHYEPDIFFINQFIKANFEFTPKFKCKLLQKNASIKRHKISY